MPLRRVNTGVSSIVGHDNGERPGGFVLVIEGTALTHVCVTVILLVSESNVMIYRHLTMKIVNDYFFDWLSNVKL